MKLATYDRVTNEDGEIGRFVPDTAKVTIRTDEEIARAKYFASLPQRKRFHHGRAYVMSSNEAVASVIRDLSFTEAGALIKLLLTLKLNNSGRLDDAKGIALSRADLAKVLGRSKSNANVTLNSLLDIGVLELTDDGCFVINEKYHVMGRNTIDGPFTKMYTVKARDMIAELKLGLNEIGLLYKITPFFHFSEYYLCVHADSKAEDIEYMGRQGLAEGIGHAADTVGRLMPKLQSAGALLITGTKNEVRYLVHPDLLFRQAEGVETDWTIAVRKLFDDHAKKARK